MKRILILGFAFQILACASTSQKDFDQIKIDMLKDDVLEVVGSPNRSDFSGGKEKWSYRIFTGDNKDQEKLLYVTFKDGKVLSYGEDTDELKRREQIHKSYEESEKRKLKKSQDVPSEPAVTAPPAQDSEENIDSTKPRKFEEQKGKRSSIESEQ